MYRTSITTKLGCAVGCEDRTAGTGGRQWRENSDKQHLTDVHKKPNGKSQFNLFHIWN